MWRRTPGRRWCSCFFPGEAFFMRSPAWSIFLRTLSLRLRRGRKGFLAPILKPLPGTAGFLFTSPRTCLRSRRSGEANWQRFVTLATIPECGARKLIVGETINPPGNWSSYPPHKHDTLVPEVEVPMEEVYHYRFSPPGALRFSGYTIPRRR